MRYFIKIDNGQIIDHPIQEDNFVSAFPNIDIDNLPPTFAEFIRRPQAPIGVFEVYQGVEYDWVGNVVEDIHFVRPMTEEEKNQTREEAKKNWEEINGPSSWIFDPETCLHNPPIPYPSDGKSYGWNNEQLNGVLVNNN